MLSCIFRRALLTTVTICVNNNLIVITEVHVTFMAVYSTSGFHAHVPHMGAADVYL